MTHASVFSGIGGPEVAATMLGWENLFHCEINPFGKRVLDYWYPNAKSYEDITKTDFTEWRGRVDVLTGGFPCQPFSYAGRRKGADDDRYLWPHMFRCIDEIRPTWVVAENVAGILTMVEQGEVSQMASAAPLFDEGDGLRGYRLRETFTMQRICDDLTSHGYAVQPILVPACAVGAPHRRDRVFIVGRRIASDTERRLRAGIGSAGDLRVVADTESVGGCGVTAEQSEPITRQNNKFDAEPSINGCVLPRTSSNTDSHRGGEVHKHMESELADGAKPFGDGGERDVADTTSGRAGRLRDKSEEKRTRMRDVVFGNGSRLCGTPDELGSRWASFPSVSPIHRGNDGIPFDVDSLTISFGKWRTESLKAYGNAIVPQVMYELFRAIEIIENEG